MTIETPAIDLKWADEKVLFEASAASSSVLDPCLVNHHPALSITNAEKEKLLTGGINQMVKLCCMEHLPSLGDQDYMEKMREFNDRLDLVKNLVRPGCSHEVLKTALSYMSSLAILLSEMPQKLQASL